MTKVLLIDPALAVGMDRFRQTLPASVEIAATTSFDDDELARLAADADILINARRRIDAAMLAMAPRVRFIQLIGIGYDTVDVAAVASAGITVAYNPGVNATGVAEQTLMLMLALVKRLPWSEQSSRAGQFATAELIGAGIDDFAGATVGLIGMGDIGTAVAERLIPFGPRVVYSSRRRRQANEETRLGATWLPLADLLHESNIVSLHLPLTPKTYHLLGDEELAAMPQGSYLINTARGGLVDEAALRRAIAREHLRGAALDVLEHETDGRNPFADLPAVIVTPHLGGGSRGSVSRMVERSVANISRFLAGEPVQDVIPGLAQANS
jgi:phosphoglycerate dehydrogenase-like enzyme